ncbi:stage II sporulation protein P [Oceanirhabdus sp. W0125-5]|uniref:stage II sporulation protein P n=1 Tax=Oceanirhabdus sp. W0125-5 TaxID=2999116 RepID=UPI0022F333B8|nr:stage II sporulation protein P [Oceanirhabdus sp. W0125-5]WBW95789.1 stage II sporulation protein P [Oceanirhabdus sp. W0125-5]
MYKRGESRESHAYKVLLFLSLLVILIALVITNRTGWSNYLFGGVYEKSIQREIPLMDDGSTDNEESLASSTLFKIMAGGVNRELNLLGFGYVQAIGVNSESVEELVDSDKDENKVINEFGYDYGAYHNREIKVNRNSSDNNLIAEVFNQSLVFNYPQDKPQVLIYHSHTGEGYYSADTDEKGSSDERDNEKNVVAVGKALAEQLEEYGIKVVHDITIHDDKNYNKAYLESGKTIDKYLNKYGDIDLVIDLHRDGVNHKSAVTTTKLNGKNVAQIMLVLDRSNEHLKSNRKVVSNLLNITNALFPEILRSNPEKLINRTSDHFSQDKSNGALIIEVGAEFNTTDEGKETAKYFGRIIAEYLYKKYSEV